MGLAVAGPAPAQIAALGFLYLPFKNTRFRTRLEAREAFGGYVVTRGDVLNALPYANIGSQSLLIGDPWTWHVAVIERIIEALRIQASTLVPAIQPLQQTLNRRVVKLFRP